MLQLNLSDLQYLREDYQSYLDRTYCIPCLATVTMIIEIIRLDDNNDIVISGKCQKCEKLISKVIEADQSEEFSKKCVHLRIAKREFGISHTTQ